MAFSLTLNGHTYNDDDYNASTNPYGLGAGGFRILLGGTGQFLTDLLVDLGEVLQMSSVSSVAIGTGAKTFTVATLRGVVVGMDCWAIYDASNRMFGTITAIDANAGTVEITVASGNTTGSGTYATWTLQPTGPQGAAPSIATVEEFMAFSGKITATLTSGTTAMTDKRRTRITGGTGTLPAFSSGSFVIAELRPANGVTVTVGRNSQTIDGTAADDTYTGDGGPGILVLYKYVSAGVITSEIIGSVL